MLIYSAITPHPPLLIPTIGKDNLTSLEKTRNALQELAHNLYSKNPDVILVISPHGEKNTNKITINQSAVLKADFKEFGDFATQKTWAGDTATAYRINEYFESKNIINLIHEETIDHGTAVPLFYLTTNLPKTKIIPLSYAEQDTQFHFNFGKELGEFIKKDDQKIAIIASGDLSHILPKKNIAPKSKLAPFFDRLILKHLAEKKYQDIVNLEVSLIKKTEQCALNSIAILLGIISETNLKYQQLSYEAPFGIGYLVAEFNLR